MMSQHETNKDYFEVFDSLPPELRQLINELGHDALDIHLDLEYGMSIDEIKRKYTNG